VIVPLVCCGIIEACTTWHRFDVDDDHSPFLGLSLEVTS
jgi:hypothetical protein